MIARAWGATAAGAGGFVASLSVATDILQFLTALLAFISTLVGFWLFVRKWRGKSDK